MEEKKQNDQEKFCITDMNLYELKKLFKEKDIKEYRAGQIFEWIYKKNVYDFEKMTNLSKEFREWLKNNAVVTGIKVVTEDTGTGKNKKVALRMKDGEIIETAVLYSKSRVTLCLSTQVGCPLKCFFCASGKSGFKRNLEVSEIVGQFLVLKNLLEEKVTNIVFMGIGEPFLNLENLEKSLKILNAPWGPEHS